jgi:hypothetical protein
MLPQICTSPGSTDTPTLDDSISLDTSSDAEQLTGALRDRERGGMCNHAGAVLELRRHDRARRYVHDPCQGGDVCVAAEVHVRARGALHGQMVCRLATRP